MDANRRWTVAMAVLIALGAAGCGSEPEPAVLDRGDPTAVGEVFAAALAADDVTTAYDLLCTDERNGLTRDQFAAGVQAVPTRFLLGAELDPEVYDAVLTFNGNENKGVVVQRDGRIAGGPFCLRTPG